VLGIAKTSCENPPPSLDDRHVRHVHRAQDAFRLSSTSRQRDVRVLGLAVDADAHGRERDPCCPRLSGPDYIIDKARWLRGGSHQHRAGDGSAYPVARGAKVRRRPDWQEHQGREFGFAVRHAAYLWYGVAARSVTVAGPLFCRFWTVEGTRGTICRNIGPPVVGQPEALDQTEDCRDDNERQQR